MQLGIAGGAYSDISIDINNQLCVNWIPMSSGPFGRGFAETEKAGRQVLAPTAGCARVLNILGQAVRNMIYAGNYLYIVVDGGVHKVQIDQKSLQIISNEFIGNLNSTSGYVSSAYNGTQIMFADDQKGYIYQDSPAVLPVYTSISQSSATVNGGTSIVITGNNFDSESKVYIGTVQATVTAFTETTITFNTPVYAGGAPAKTIRLSNKYGNIITPTTVFTYTVTAPTLGAAVPTAGSTTGETLLQVDGTNFIQGMTITIASLTLTNVRVNSPTSAFGVVSAGVPASGPFNVVVNNGVGTASLTSAFTFNTSSPTLTAITPNVANFGTVTPATAIGTNLSAVTSVTVGGVTATNLVVVDANTLTFDVPAYVSGALVVDVIALAPGRNALFRSSFTYLGMAPDTATIAPQKGSTSGGTFVTITGTNTFTPTTTVKLGDKNLTILSITSSTITGLTPATDDLNTASTVDMTITNEYGSEIYPDAYTYETGVFSEIMSPGYEGGSTVVFIDGYFVVNRPNSGVICFSELNDGLTWDALSVATAESSPDNITTLGVSKGELWVLGENSTEIWFNAGNATGAPFSPRVGLELQIGCQAVQSAVAVNDLLIWVDSRGYIVQSDITPYLRNNNTGYELQIISTDALTEELLNYVTLEDAIAISYNDRGHLMYQITFPSANKTWVFDYLTKQWHERLYFDPSSDTLGQHLGQYFAQYGRLALIGGTRSGIIYVQDYKYLDDDGQNIRRYRTTPFLYGPDSVQFITASQIALKIGQIFPIPVTGPNSNPQIGLRYSKDGGHTWSNRVWRDLGKTGHYKDLITWNRLGTSRQWMFEFLVSDKVSVTLIDGWLNEELET